MPPGVEWQVQVFGMRAALAETTEDRVPHVMARALATYPGAERDPESLHDAALAGLAQKLCPHVVVDGVPGPVPHGLELM